jgi:hypothetical protein
MWTGSFSVLVPGPLLHISCAMDSLHALVSGNFFLTVYGEIPCSGFWKFAYFCIWEGPLLWYRIVPISLLWCLEVSHSLRSGSSFWWWDSPLNCICFRALVSESFQLIVYRESPSFSIWEFLQYLGVVTERFLLTILCMERSSALVTGNCPLIMCGEIPKSGVWQFPVIGKGNFPTLLSCSFSLIECGVLCPGVSEFLRNWVRSLPSLVSGSFLLIVYGEFPWSSVWETAWLICGKLSVDFVLAGCSSFRETNYTPETCTPNFPRLLCCNFM